VFSTNELLNSLRMKGLIDQDDQSEQSDQDDQSDQIPGDEME
jgi:hypothetical protein